jgi:predicted AlkP superfamily phosphohydrolase/phosphomutase
MYDWRHTAYFPLPMDQAGYIRINLRDREKDGIVEPGVQYEKLCDELEQHLLSLHDRDSGQFIVRKVIRAWQEAPADAPARDVLPDLVVIWNNCSTAECRCIVSGRLPGFAMPVPDHNSSGRSGNHAGEGWFVVHGPGLVHGTHSAPDTTGQTGLGTIRDLAPTIFKTLGATPPAHMKGHALLWQLAAADDN